MTVLITRMLRERHARRLREAGLAQPRADWINIQDKCWRHIESGVSLMIWGLIGTASFALLIGLVLIATNEPIPILPGDNATLFGPALGTSLLGLALIGSLGALVSLVVGVGLCLALPPEAKTRRYVVVALVGMAGAFWANQQITIDPDMPHRISFVAIPLMSQLIGAYFLVRFFGKLNDAFGRDYAKSTATWLKWGILGVLVMAVLALVMTDVGTDASLVVRTVLYAIISLSILIVIVGLITLMSGMRSTIRQVRKSSTYSAQRSAQRDALAKSPKAAVLPDPNSYPTAKLATQQFDVTTPSGGASEEEKFDASAATTEEKAATEESADKGDADDAASKAGDGGDGGEDKDDAPRQS